MNRKLHNDTEPIYTLSVAAKLSNIPQHSIRQYIDNGLIIPFKKETNRHLFSDVDIERLLWIKKCLEEDGLNFAGIKSVLSLIPCWKITNCSQSSRSKCDAYYVSNVTCWEASDKGKDCRNKDCRECKVYQVVNTDLELKSVLRGFLP